MQTVDLRETKAMKHNITKASAATEVCVSLFIVAVLSIGIALVTTDMLSIGRMTIGVVAVFGSFGPVIAISALPGNLTQTFASGDRVLNLLSEEPAVKPVEDGEKMDYDNLNVTGLSFSCDGETQVLSDICMHAEKGEITVTILMLIGFTIMFGKSLYVPCAVLGGSV